MTGLDDRMLLLHVIRSLKSNDSWCGETHIQKSVYFLKAGLRVDLPFSFFLYMYGPFSLDVERRLGEMRGISLIDLESRTPYGPSIVLGELGKALINRDSQLPPLLASQIDFVASEIGTGSVSKLERICTALYVHRSHPGKSESERAEEIHRLKPHVSVALAQSAIQDVKCILDLAHGRGLVNIENSDQGRE